MVRVWAARLYGGGDDSRLVVRVPDGEATVACQHLGLGGALHPRSASTPTSRDPTSAARCESPPPNAASPDLHLAAGATQTRDAGNVCRSTRLHRRWSALARHLHPRSAVATRALDCPSLASPEDAAAARPGCDGWGPADVPRDDPRKSASIRKAFEATRGLQAEPPALTRACR